MRKHPLQKPKSAHYCTKQKTAAPMSKNILSPFQKKKRPRVSGPIFFLRHNMPMLHCVLLPLLIKVLGPRGPYRTLISPPSFSFLFSPFARAAREFFLDHRTQTEGKGHENQKLRATTELPKWPAGRQPDKPATCKNCKNGTWTLGASPGHGS